MLASVEIASEDFAHALSRVIHPDSPEINRLMNCSMTLCPRCIPVFARRYSTVTTASMVTTTPPSNP